MEDPELTRKAIAELMEEMNEKGSIPVERKKNPLGKPNKHFLGRTISSIMTHNKRQNDRNIQGCERKLKEMDEKQRIHKYKKHRRKTKCKYLHKCISNNSNDEEYAKISRKTIRTKKKKKRRSYSISSSCTSDSNRSNNKVDFSNSNVNSPTQNKTRKDTVDMPLKEKYKQNICKDYNNDSTVGYYLDPNMAYAAMAYNQINHMMQQHELVQPHPVKNDPEESIEIPSDLSLSCHFSSESSLNISFHSSSAEEDENGILTFKLSSDEETQKLNKKSTEIRSESSPVDCDEYDKGSETSHISLESNDSQNSNLKQSNQIYSLSSSCTNSDDSVEIVETLDNIKNDSKADKITENHSIQISEMCNSDNLNK